MEKIIEYLVIVLIGAGAVCGLMRGFVNIFFSWFSILVGVIISMNFSYGVTSAFLPEFKNNILVIFLVGIVLFSIVYIIFVQIAGMFSRFLVQTNLHVLDYLLGGVFGGAQLMIVVGLCLYWLLKVVDIDLSSNPVSMFSMFWSEKIITLLGTHLDAANHLL